MNVSKLLLEVVMGTGSFCLNTLLSAPTNEVTVKYYYLFFFYMDHKQRITQQASMDFSL